MRYNNVKLLLENWRDTSWKTDDGTVTIGEVDDYLGNKTYEINTLEVRDQVLKNRNNEPLPTTGQDRVDAANLEYPIIVLKSGGEYTSVLDGNHRLQKAIDKNLETIKAKVLVIDDEETPEVFKNMFGGTE